MTTDTAVRVTRIIVQEKSTNFFLWCLLAQINVTAAPLDKIPYIDDPELRVDKHESTEMPFRYVKDENGKPIMPEVIRLFYGRDYES